MHYQGLKQLKDSSENFFLLAGPCVIEGEAMAMDIAEKVVAGKTGVGITLGV